MYGKKSVSGGNNVRTFYYYFIKIETLSRKTLRIQNIINNSSNQKDKMMRFSMKILEVQPNQNISLKLTIFRFI